MVDAAGLQYKPGACSIWRKLDLFIWQLADSAIAESLSCWFICVFVGFCVFSCLQVRVFAFVLAVSLVPCLVL